MAQKTANEQIDAGDYVRVGKGTPAAVGRVAETKTWGRNRVVYVDLYDERDPVGHERENVTLLGDWAEDSSERIRAFVAHAKDAAAAGNAIEVGKAGRAGVYLTSAHGDGKIDSNVLGLVSEYGLEINAVEFHKNRVLIQDPLRT